MQDFRRGRHSVSRLTVHLVCVTKYRRRVFDAAALDWLRGHFDKVCQTMDCTLLACDGEADHVHALIDYPPKLSVSVLVNALKGTSSRLLRQERPDIGERYWKGVLWSPSYFAASTGGATLETMKLTIYSSVPAAPEDFSGSVIHEIYIPPIPSFPTTFRVLAAWDGDAQVWYVKESDLPGLNAEAKTPEDLAEKLKSLVPELAEVNRRLFGTGPST